MSVPTGLGPGDFTIELRPQEGGASSLTLAIHRSVQTSSGNLWGKPDAPARVQLGMFRPAEGGNVYEVVKERVKAHGIEVWF